MQSIDLSIDTEKMQMLKAVPVADLSGLLFLVLAVSGCGRFCLLVVVLGLWVVLGVAVLAGCQRSCAAALTFASKLTAICEQS